MKIKNMTVKFKTGESEGLADGEFLVYPSTFTRTPDSYGDVVAKGAFANGIEKRKQNGHQLPALFMHRIDDLNAYVGYAIEEGEDDHGWWVKGAFDLADANGAKLYRLVKAGRIRELSFAYDVLDGGEVTLDDGSKAFELRDLDVFEFSFVPVGANRDTSIVAVKSAVDALIKGVKAGTTLSAENEQTLIAAVESLDAAVTSIKNVLSNPSESTGDDPAKTGGQTNVKDEGATNVKSEGNGINPTRLALANHFITQAL